MCIRDSTIIVLSFRSRKYINIQVLKLYSTGGKQHLKKVSDLRQNPNLMFTPLHFLSFKMTGKITNQANHFDLGYSRLHDFDLLTAGQGNMFWYENFQRRQNR